MWVPRDVQEIEEAVEANRLEETHSFDGKALPGRNKDIAIDVCAMTVDGGSLLYGVGEDPTHRLTVREPFTLAGERDRIDQIVQTSIVEVPASEIREYPLPNEPATGYIAIAVSQSPRAPHQVVVGGEMRYYGRGATGNRILTEGEVANLYARRQRWELDRDAHLSAVVDAAPLEHHNDVAYMHAFARPVTFDARFLRSQIANDETEMELRNALIAGINVIDQFTSYVPDLRQLRGWQLFGAEGIVLEGAMNDRRRAIRMTIGHSGEARLFACAGARYQDGQIGIFDTLIAGNLTSFLSAAGTFYARARYMGNVDIGAAVTGIHRGIADAQHQRGLGEFDFAYPSRDFRSTDRVVARQLVERPRDVAFELLHTFFDALGGVGWEPRVGIR